MAHLCPPWIGWLLVNPARKLTESPEKLLGPYVRKGMTVLEPGCAMGYFTLPLARMVGDTGKVVALDVQQQMLDGLKKRASRADLMDRLDIRLVNGSSDEMEDLAGTADFAAALNMIHETQDTEGFLRQMRDALKPGGKLLVLEPRFHVSTEDFSAMVATAEANGLALDQSNSEVSKRRAVFVKETR